MNKELIDITTYTGDGYRPVVDYESWRVAVLNYCEELEVQNLKTMQKHEESDEVFVLLSGHCTLFTGGNSTTIQEVDGIAMEPYLFYNVKRGTWHTHTLDKEAMVLIVENRNTTNLNSPTLSLTNQQMDELRKVFTR